MEPVSAINYSLWFLIKQGAYDNQELNFSLGKLNLGTMLYWAIVLLVNSV